MKPDSSLTRDQFAIYCNRFPGFSPALSHAFFSFADRYLENKLTLKSISSALDRIVSAKSIQELASSLAVDIIS
jgi:hypothetical protein